MDIPGIRHRIIKHLPAYLLKYGSVDLAGLGRFRLDPRTSFIDYSMLLVFPPYYDVVFDETQYTRANDYVAYLSKRLGLDDALIAEVMLAYTHSIRQRLAHDKIATVDGLGRLTHTDKNRLSFESDKQYWGQQAVANLAISFEPVPRVKEMADKQPVTSLDVNVPQTIIPGEEDFLELKEELLDEDWDEDLVDSDMDVEGEEEVLEETTVQSITVPPLVVEPVSQMQADNTHVATPLVRSDKLVDTTQQSKNHRFIVPLMVLLLLLAIPLFWYLTRGEHHEGEMAEIEVPTDRLNQNPKEIIEPQKNIESNQDKAASAIPLPKEDEKSITANEQPKTSVPEEINKSTPEVPKKSDENSSSSNTIKKSNSTVLSGDCVIIVGAFGEGPNMRKMMSRLEAKGFKVYVDSTRSLSRVGVYSTCRSAELQQNLSIIQSDIEPKSWILNR